MAVCFVYATLAEYSMRSAEPEHNWDSQPQLFGSEQKKLLEACDRLKKAFLQGNSGEVEHLFRKICGIARSHGLYVSWGRFGATCQPDRFLIMKNRAEIGFIQT